jgi:hypothetical protein
MIIVKNTSGIVKIWCGQTLEIAGQYSMHSSEQSRWANDDEFLTAIVDLQAVVNDGYRDLLPGPAINLLKQIAMYPGTYMPSDYKDLFYKKIPAFSENISSGIVIPNGERVGLYRFRANGADACCYVVLVWNYQGADEKIFVATKGDIDLFFDVNNEQYQIVGNGVKKLSILLVNNNENEGPYIGGDVDLLRL